MYVHAFDGECVESEGSLGALYGLWVTRPIDSSAVESGGAAEKCHSH